MGLGAITHFAREHEGKRGWRTIAQFERRRRHAHAGTQQLHRLEQAQAPLPFAKVHAQLRLEAARQRALRRAQARAPGCDVFGIGRRVIDRLAQLAQHGGLRPGQRGLNVLQPRQLIEDQAVHPLRICQRAGACRILLAQPRRLADQLAQQRGHLQQRITRRHAQARRGAQIQTAKLRAIARRDLVRDPGRNPYRLLGSADHALTGRLDDQRTADRVNELMPRMCMGWKSVPGQDVLRPHEHRRGQSLDLRHLKRLPQHRNPQAALCRFIDIFCRFIESTQADPCLQCPSCEKQKHR